MGGLLDAKDDHVLQPSVLIPLGIAGISGTCKRKWADDDAGPLSASGSYSELTKRHKYVNGYTNSDVGASRECFFKYGSIDGESNGEENSGSSWIDSLSYQSAPHTNSHAQTSELSASPTGEIPPARCSSVSADIAILPDVAKESQRAPKETINVSDRKRHFMYSPSDTLKEKMEKHLHNVYKLLDEMRSEDDCWLHPTPPARRSGRGLGTIPCNFGWKDSSGKHTLRVNIGMVALVVENQLTEKQMEGYVDESWHLSHLCGNWTCCNWRHMTVESGQTNIRRNQCFRNTTHCVHHPKCMKSRKRRLLVTVDISNKIRSAIESIMEKAIFIVGCQYPTTTTGWYDCGICGEGIVCVNNRRICPSLTSITKSQEVLEKLESCTHRSDEIVEAIAYLERMIADLIRAKEASDSATLERVQLIAK